MHCEVFECIFVELNIWTSEHHLHFVCNSLTCFCFTFPHTNTFVSALFSVATTTNDKFKMPSVTMRQFPLIRLIFQWDSCEEKIIYKILTLHDQFNCIHLVLDKIS